MQYLGEIISIGVAVSWTLSALFFEIAGKKIGSLTVNILRLIFAFFLLGTMLFIATGSYFPQNADVNTWIWMILSGLVGFVFGDLCLFYSYLLITARFSQLLMTLAPPFAAFFGWILLGEKLSPMGFVGMAVTLLGISISVLKRGGSSKNAGQNADRNLNQINDQGLVAREDSTLSLAGVINEAQNHKANLDNTLVASDSDLVVCETESETAGENKQDNESETVGENKQDNESVGRSKRILGKLKPNLKLHIPLNGLLLGIGGALGQGLGIVLSKQGMNYYAISAKGTEAASYIPFAATQIRIITGTIGFALIILLSGRLKNFKEGIKDGKAVGTTFLGSIFGPFIGVSLSLMAIQHTNTAIASTIMATTPIIILIPYFFIYHKKITPVEVLGAVLSVVGVSLFFL